MTNVFRMFCASLLPFALLTNPAVAQVVMPPLNMGGTSFLDGVAGPGVLIEPGVVEHYHASRFVDSNGATIPGHNSIDTWANLFHAGYITTHKLLGGFYGTEILVPAVSVEIATDFGPKGKQSALGDILVSPLIIEWPSRGLSGKAFFSRFSVLTELPTGSYDRSRTVNVGHNSTNVFAYYAITIFPREHLETSWRINYRWNGRNSNPFSSLGVSSTQAGQAIHANYAISYEISRSFRIGANGYVLQQLTEHQLGGASMRHSKERVVGFGPGAALSSGFWTLIGNVDFETLARNRRKDTG